MSATDVPKMYLENHLVPVTDVDRAKGFYARLGWRLDDDVARQPGPTPRAPATDPCAPSTVPTAICGSSRR